MAKIVHFVCLLSLVKFGLGLELKAKAYENLVVSVDEGVPVEDCKVILTNLETTLAGASQYLFSALDSRAYLRSATVLLPSSWPDSCAPGSVTSASGESSDVTVLPGDSTRGRVWTQQSLGCGQPGDQIFIGYQNLKTRDNTIARSLVKEFAMYRYGVFEEQGYTNDPIYPMCYLDDQTKEAKITGCSDLPIQTNGICEGTSSEYNVTKLVSPNSRSSITFAAEAPSVSMFCDEGNHNRFAPTKHNSICQHKSTLDVIINHPDFLRSNEENVIHNGQITDTTPKITYKKQNLTRYVLVIENTKEMLERESWSYLRLAVRKWVVFDLPENTEIGLVLTNETSAQRVLNIMDRYSGRDLVPANIPYTPGDSSQASCINCAIKEAMEMLVERTRTHGNARDVILVVAPGLNLNNQIFATLKEVQKKKIHVATINYPSIIRADSLDVLAKETDGDAYTVFEKKLNVETSILSTYFELSNVFYSIARKYFSGNQADLPIEIHRREIKDDGRSSVTGSFMLDSTMGEPARFMLYTHNSDTPLIKGLKLISPSHQIFTNRSEFMLNVKVISVVSNISETGTWTYTIEPYAGNPQPHFLQILATPKTPSAPIVKTKFWTHRNQPGSPLILLTEAKKDEFPILGAKVEVVVTKHEVNGTVVYKDRFDLLDTGSGDPDITKGDGVYTRYFNAASGGPGIYSFEVTVTDNGNTAYSWQGAPFFNDNKPCCGSFVPSANVQPLSPFQRVLPPLTMEITSEEILESNKATVGRIGDLKAEIIVEEMKARLSWTAPDMGGQTVAKYEIKYANSVRDIMDNFDNVAQTWEVGSPFPLSPGSETTFTVDLSQDKSLLDKPLYFAVRSFLHSHDSHSGTISNWVRVFVASPPPPPTAPPTYTSGDQSSWPFQVNEMGNNGDNPSIAKSMSLGLELILPIAIGFILLVILLILYCYFCVIKRKTHESHKKAANDKLNSTITIVPSSPQHVPQNYSSQIDLPDPHTVGVPISNYGYEEDTKKRYSLVHQQEQQLIEELKQQQQMQHQMQPNNNYSGVSVISNSTLQRNGHTLSPYNSWSASQLLHEHERRHSPMQDDQLLQHQEMMLNGSQIDQLSLNGPNMDHTHFAHPPPVPPLPTFTSNGYPINYNIYGVHTPNGQQIYQSMQRNDQIGPFAQSLQGSLSSVNSGDKKRRNVTMV